MPTIQAVFDGETLSRAFSTDSWQCSKCKCIPDDCIIDLEKRDKINHAIAILMSLPFLEPLLADEWLAYFMAAPINCLLKSPTGTEYHPKAVTPLQFALYDEQYCLAVYLILKGAKLDETYGQTSPRDKLKRPDVRQAMSHHFNLLAAKQGSNPAFRQLLIKLAHPKSYLSQAKWVFEMFGIGALPIIVEYCKTLDEIKSSMLLFDLLDGLGDHPYKMVVINALRQPPTLFRKGPIIAQHFRKEFKSLAELRNQPGVASSDTIGATPTDGVRSHPDQSPRSYTGSANKLKWY